MALQLELSAAEFDRILQEKENHPHPFVRKKCEVLLLKAHGLPTQKISKICGITDNTVRNYIKEYQSSGIEAICETRWVGTTSLLDGSKDKIAESFTQAPPHSAVEAQARIEQMTGIKRSLSGVKEFLYRIGMKYRKSAVIPAKANPEAQEEFKKNSWTLA